MANNIRKIVEANKAQKDAIRKQQLAAQKNLNARMDGLSLKNTSPAEYSAPQARHYDKTVYLVDKGDHIELYKGDIPISGEGGGLVIENGVVVDNLQFSEELPSRFGWAYIGTGDYSETAATKATDHTRVTEGVIPENYSVYNGGGVGRIVINDRLRGVVANPNRVAPVSRASDGKSSISFNIRRSGTNQIETLSYKIILGAARNVYSDNAVSGVFSIEHNNYLFLLCSRTVGDNTQEFIFNLDNYNRHSVWTGGGSNSALIEPTEETRGDQIVLTLAFLDLTGDLIPYLYLESSREQLNANGHLIETQASRYLATTITESGAQFKALGLLYDPETLERLPDPIFYDISEDNLMAGRIISYNEDIDI